MRKWAAGRPAMQHLFRLAPLAVVTTGMALAQTGAGVSGGGEIINGTGERARVTLVQEVKPRQDGSISGELELHEFVLDPATGGETHYVTRERAVCLELRGNEAWVGTVVMATTRSEYAGAGTQGVWYFADYGQAAETPDEVSVLHEGGSDVAQRCRDPETQAILVATASPLLRGDLWVREE